MKKALAKKIIRSVGSIDYRNPNQLYHHVRLSDGQVLKLWTGQPTSLTLDYAVGCIAVGAYLKKVEERYCPATGDTQKIYHFRLKK